jgi:D-methionine transport system permease protein
MFESIISALYETLAMILISGTLSLICSVFLVTHLSYFSKQSKISNSTRKIISNVLRSINLTPFLLIMLLMAPFVKLLISMQVSVTVAVCIPLTLVGIAFFTQQLNRIFSSIPSDIKEMAHNIGASKSQLIFNFIIPETLPKIVRSASELMIKLINLSTIAGIFGAGGLGYIAMQHGYYDFNFFYLAAITLTILMLIKLFQLTGFLLAEKILKR